MKTRRKRKQKSPGPARTPIAINEAEAIIDGFWDKDLAPLACYTLCPAHAIGAADHPRPEPAAAGGRSPSAPLVLGPLGPDRVRASQAWCWLTFDWDRPPRTQTSRRQRGSAAASLVLSFERELHVDLTGYDRLVVRMACPPHARLTVVATLDGITRTMINAEPGRGIGHEFEGPLHGTRLEWIRLELASTRDGAAEAWLDWVGCARSAGRTAMLTRPPQYSPDWEGWLLPEGTAAGCKLRFGFFFDDGELVELRRKALSPLYRPIMDQLRATARAAMSAPRTPEHQIGPLIGAGDNSTTLVRERDLPTRSFHTDAPICALVGLIDQDPACLRFAARIAMSLAHAGTWAPHFMQEFPGTSWDQRGFPEAFAMAGVALALDWAGAWFTPKGEHLVRHAIATKGLPRVRTVFLQYEYMLNCNQSHMIGLGRLLGLLVLEKAWPRTRADIDVFEQDLLEIIDRYIQSDGSTDEGLHYWNSTFRTTVPSLAALARFRGRTLAAMIPPKIKAMDSYIASLLSTTGVPGSYLTIADTVADSFALDAIAMMAAATGSPLWRGLLADCFRRNKQVKAERWSCDGPFAVIHGPAACPAEAVKLPVFTKLAKAGHVSSCRPLGDGCVRLFLVGAMANAGHCHRDKGSFILEADGEAFAIDRGMVPYHDSDNLPFLKSELAHNLAVPDGCAQRNPSPSASNWMAKGNAVALKASVDTGGTWLPPVVASRRTVTSLSPDCIEIRDEFELTEPRAATFYLHSPLPMVAGKQQAEIRGRRLTLTVRADWAVTKTAEACGVNWCYTPVNRLALVSVPATQHRLVTVLEFQRPAKRTPACRTKGTGPAAT
jgi:hypothetical protein